MGTARRGRIDPEIERLLYVNKVLKSLIQRGGTLLEKCGFPKSSLALASLAKAFEAELEGNLLRAYDAAPRHATRLKEAA